MRVDAHQNYWQIGRNGQTWPGADLPAICRDFLPGALEPHLAALAIDATVAVQSQPDSRDTTWLLDLADRTPSIAGVVGWMDLKAPDADRRLSDLAGHPRLRGIRPMLQDLPTDWILDPAVAPAIETMVDHGLVFDALIRPRHISAIAQFARAHPRLTIVVDHAAKPDIASGDRAGWARSLFDLAECPNVHCKLSGLITEAAADWCPEDIGPYIGDVVRLFGAERTMWGSDWPVMLLGGDYRGWHDLVTDRVAALGEGACDAIFGGTAAKVYRL
ncbi:amidohydrolase [Sphingomonas sp.]|uniref:amidohydrolase family protein n=1 Tax=Sphingomonas sp. TaxID=28214 RepID=UPI000DB64294|nr:amidohydrolase family protein [Sphingomonas sp.]PZU10948.1 MAG: amidohydrolase [Sphingomonas sp.]